MKSQNQLILNQRRDFGDALGDSVTFLKLNFKPILTVFLTYVVPLLLVPLLLLMATGLLSDVMTQFSGLGMLGASEGAAAGFVIVMLGFLVLYFFAYMILNLTVFGAFLSYEENGNVKVTAAEIKEKMKAYFGNYFVSLIIVILIMVLLYTLIILISIIGSKLGVIATVLAMTIMLCVFVWVMIVINNFSWIRMREDLGIGSGIERSFALIKNNWWSMFGILFVASMAASICSYVFSIPFYIFTFMAGTSMADGDMMNTTIMGILGGLSFFIYLLGSIFLQQYVTACTVMKYYDLVEQKDGSSIAIQIDQLGETPDSFFENEGEY